MSRSGVLLVIFTRRTLEDVQPFDRGEAQVVTEHEHDPAEMIHGP